MMLGDSSNRNIWRSDINSNYYYCYHAGGRGETGIRILLGMGASVARKGMLTRMRRSGGFSSGIVPEGFEPSSAVPRTAVVDQLHYGT